MKTLVIRKEDLKHNINKINEYLKLNSNNNCAKIIAVVKSNGYGLGLIEYTKFLIDNGIKMFAVATVDEAIKLKKGGVKEDVILLSSTCILKDIEELIENEVILTIGSKEAGQVIDKIAKDKKIIARVHLKIDTGFGRYGFVYNQQEELSELLKSLKNIKIEGAFTNFSVSFYKKDKITIQQFNRFMKVIEYLKVNNINTGMLHVCNSSAFIKFPYMYLDAVRIGSAFLGRLALTDKVGLKKIGYMISNIVEIKSLPKNFNIGYSNIYKTKKETTVAVVPVGYSDGYNVHANNDMFRFIDSIRDIYSTIKKIFKNNKLEVNINNQRYEVLGRIGMNYLIIDVTNSNVKIGDEVILNINPIYVDSSIRREYQ